MTHASTLPCRCGTPPLIVLPVTSGGLWCYDICRTCHVIGPHYSEASPGWLWSSRTMRYVTMAQFIAEGLRYTVQAEQAEALSYYKNGSGGQ